MSGRRQGEKPYAVEKLYQANLDQNVNGRKKVHGADYALASTAKRLQDGFTGKMVTNTKKKSPAASSETHAHATRSATTAASAERIASSTKNVFDGKNPFTPAKKGRPPKSASKQPANAATNTNNSTDPQKHLPLQRRRRQCLPVTQQSVLSESTTDPKASVTPFALISSCDRGSRRLLPDDIMELQANDEIILVVPIDKPRAEGDAVRDIRANLKSRLKKRLINAEFSTKYSGLSSEERDKLFDKTVRERHSVQRDGEWYSEFVGTVINFPYRDDYKTWSKVDVDRHMDQNGSFSVLFSGYEELGRSTREFELQLNELTSVEVWKRRDIKEGFSPFIRFNGGIVLEKLGKKLVEMLSLVEGDVTSSLEVLYKFYRGKSEVLVNNLRHVKDKLTRGEVKTKEEETERSLEILREEIKNSKLCIFLATADKIWYEAIINHCEASHCISGELIEEKEYIDLYKSLAKLFPLHAASLLNISCHERFFQPARFDKEKLNGHKKVALTHFFALCRSRNSNHMVHWAMTETMLRKFRDDKKRGPDSLEILEICKALADMILKKRKRKDAECGKGGNSSTGNVGEGHGGKEKRVVVAAEEKNETEDIPYRQEWEEEKNGEEGKGESDDKEGQCVAVVVGLKRHADHDNDNDIEHEQENRSSSKKKTRIASEEEIGAINMAGEGESDKDGKKEEES